MQETIATGERTGGPWKRFFCIHGHFYQPPRENPWLEVIEVEDSAAPYHDWNQRVCAECYAPNAHARLVQGAGEVHRMVNNYEWISFNLGPTLLAWMKRHEPALLQAILDADRKSSERCGGHGNAIAQAYNHTILPLASRRDKSLQVRWGIEVFRETFRREPEGMWLPEAAVDTESLEVLAENRIRFVLLSPRQAKRVRRDGSWQSLGPGDPPLDTRRPYRCRLPSGADIALFFYDGDTAHRVAFQRLLSDGESFFRHMQSRFDTDPETAQLVHFATDGETFGHHHRFGEMALAYFIARVEGDEQVRLTNYGEFLALHPPVWEAEIVENSSWSCAHGVERWRSDCGCRPTGSSFHQRWRGPLREALNQLKERLDALYEKEAGALLRDPWDALEGYIHVLLHREEAGIRSFLGGAAPRQLSDGEVTKILKLLEMERHGQLMFTSCAWFFDEISRIETVQILKFAARAIQLAERNFHVSLEQDFLEMLERASSNHPTIGNGKKLWLDEVSRAVTDLERVLAHFAISLVFQRDPSPNVGNGYSVKRIDTSIQEIGHAHFVVGTAEVVSHVTLQRSEAVYGVVHFGGMDVQFFWMPREQCEDYETVKEDLIRSFEDESLGDLYQRLLHQFRGPTHQLQDLFRDEQRRIVEATLKERIQDYEVIYGQLFDQDHALLNRLAALRYPIPEPMKMAARACTEFRIRERADHLDSREDLRAFSQLLEKARQWGYSPDASKWERFFLLRLESCMQDLLASDRTEACLEKAETVLEAARLLDVKLNLWNIQDLYLEVCKQRAPALRFHRDAVRAFAGRIQLNPEVLPPSLR